MLSKNIQVRGFIMFKPLLENLPLAARMRPQQLSEFFGQSHLVGKGRVLSEAVARKSLHSMILWGPPGTGKTTLARLLAQSINAEIEELSAVVAGVKEIRAVVERAEQRQLQDRKTVLFVDEVHRFSKSQQDAFLPYIENGLFIFIGATTENPSFELNHALLSRVRVHVLKTLSDEDLLEILNQALSDKARGLGSLAVQFSEQDRQQLVIAAGGDARRLLNWLESLVEMAPEKNGTRVIELATLKEVLGKALPRYDKGGEAFYDIISALHKSIRGSDPDAALYWLCRMLVGGCDPLYIARRLVRVASEDIGNADPRALSLTLEVWDVQERLGSPEGELALAQAVIYLASAPKSNAVYMAYKAAMQEAESSQVAEVPIYLRNAPTKLMKQLGYGKAYRYAHDEPEAYAAGEHYFPEGHEAKVFYQPTDRGLEKQIKAKLDYLKQLDQTAKTSS
jgi:putative ATPase